MFRFHLASIRLIATTLLVVFGSALLGPAVAAAHELHEGGEHLHLPGLPQAHHHHDEDDDDDHPAGQHPAAHQVAHAPKSYHGHHACTGDDEQQLAGVSPLAKLLTDHAAPAVLALPPALSFGFRPFQAWDRQLAVVLVPPAHLKPKIPDLRIFIGSLVI
ncbi:hypothetical protein MON38_20500 [Hymenobacter sp. DH14]|uniref:Cobalt transporter n=1 Tax=Hymenobacter cyanobacteriorum TaxID=2926463 RepID=A0A9X1VII0_9BACT|nr:hypothetical protein [Hymenobacter cyanobacteriorum]MCI1189809.1 hypothetical protein [Hymenobacter cyanobacteriorum]